jgi:hypothetical protein
MTSNDMPIPKSDSSTFEQAAQTHIHEFLCSTMISGQGQMPHNHRFLGVTSQAIPLPDGNHKHIVLAETDFAVGHLHEFNAETGPAIHVGSGKHVHFVNGKVSNNMGHSHDVIFATLIDDLTY